MKKRVTAIVFTLALINVGYGVLMYARYMRHGAGDFLGLYTGGLLVRTGQASRSYDLELQWQAQQPCCAQAVAIHRGIPMHWNHAPYEAVILAPLSLLSYPQAYTVWCLVNFGILFYLAWRLRAQTELFLARWWLLPLAAIAAYPVFFDISQGQDSLWLALIYLGVYFAWTKGQRGRAGLLLSLGLFKPHLVLPWVAIWFLRRQWKALAGFAAAATALGLFSVALMGGWQPARSYVTYLLQYNRDQYTFFGGISNMTNLFGLLHLFWPQSPFVLTMALSALLVAATAWWWGKNEERNFLLGTLTILLVSYHSYPYDMALLLCPLILFLPQLAVRQRWTVFGLVAPLFLLPLMLFSVVHQVQAWAALILFALLFYVVAVAQPQPAQDRVSAMPVSAARVDA